jgi:hypothetical protein
VALESSLAGAWMEGERMKFTRGLAGAVLMAGVTLSRADRPAPAAVVSAAALNAHPWNIFMAGESVRIPLPAPDARQWTLWEYDGRERAGGPPIRGWAEIGALPPGYYEVREKTAARSVRVSLVVLWPETKLPPADSAISLDVAGAWRFGEGQRDLAANLCRLLGVNWVRDRFNWMETEPWRGVFPPATRSDISVATQAARGLRVLEVNHFTPKWANPNAVRFPLDLRDAYQFYKAVAQRWQGRVPAFEPWNEPDIDVFGAHVGSQIASFQKAAYLGIKAGNSNAVVCQSVFAAPNDAILDDFQANETWPYFDTLNFHTYGPLENYPQVFAEFRSVSAGKPLWLTECNLPLHWSGDPERQELSEEDVRLQAERLPKVYATALHEGAANIFYFTLAHYSEGNVHYGLLHADGTPQPALMALAAVARFLGTAKPLGRWRFGDSPATAYCFRVRPPHGPRDLMVVWSTNQPVNLTLPLAPSEAFDALGREIKRPEATIKSTSRPRYLVFPAGSLARLALEPPPRPATLQEEAPGLVVIQPPMLHRVNQGRSAFRLTADKENRMPVRVYNFSDQTVEGEMQLTIPTNWTGQFAQSLRIEPGGMAEEFLILNPQGNRSGEPDAVRLYGDFGAGGHATLSFRAMAEKFDLAGFAAQSLPEAVSPKRWEPVVSGGGTMKITEADGGLLIEGLPGSNNGYVHPKIELTAGERMDQECEGVACHLQLIEGKGEFYVIFEQGNGSSYLSYFDEQPAPGTSVEAVARTELAIWGATWSNPDDKSRLDLSDVRSLEIGCSTSSPSVKFLMKDLRWLRRARPAR